MKKITTVGQLRGYLNPYKYPLITVNVKLFSSTTYPSHLLEKFREYKDYDILPYFWRVSGPNKELTCYIHEEDVPKETYKAGDRFMCNGNTYLLVNDSRNHNSSLYTWFLVDVVSGVIFNGKEYTGHKEFPIEKKHIDKMFNQPAFLWEKIEA